MKIESLETVLKTGVVISSTGPEIEIKIDTLEMIAIVEKQEEETTVPGTDLETEKEEEKRRAQVCQW